MSQTDTQRLADIRLSAARLVLRFEAAVRMDEALRHEEFVSGPDLARRETETVGKVRAARQELLAAVKAGN